MSADAVRREEHPRRGCWEIPPEAIALLFARKPTPEMIEHASRETETRGADDPEGQA